jgi:hypothetical protein
MRTKVIFKRDINNDNEIVAIFPYVRWNSKSEFMPSVVCYAHIGQHFGAEFDYGFGLPTATESEYKDLLNELKGIYDDTELVVLKRLPLRSVLWSALKR